MDNFITFDVLGKSGRIGNQLFQVAAAIGYSKMYNIPLVLPKWYCTYDKINYSDYFKNKLNQTLDIDLIKKNYREPSFEYDIIPEFKQPVNLLGYYQSEKYFQHCINDIKYYFEPENFLFEKINDKYSKILNDDTCSIHIRRGDYIGSNTHEVCNLEYYKKCIELMIPYTHKFIIFSDDINWCRNEFIDVQNIEFIEGNNPIEDLFTMSMCKNHIISNSSFSWWGSWLNNNPNKITYVPSKWFADTSSIKKYETIFRKDMIRI